ncbi:MAG: VOC family protein [Betaproteobacteria bacterium]|nr:MAG: VOC family protein [Betaproteobacteria bacterium]
MKITRLNHAVLFVRSATLSAKFYADAFGFVKAFGRGEDAIFMRAANSTNDHDLGLFSLGANAGDTTAGRSSVGLYHLAWQVESLTDLLVMRERLMAMNALTGESDHGTTKSLYGRDIDGIEFEVMWLVPPDVIIDDDRANAGNTRRVNWDKVRSDYPAH